MREIRSKRGTDHKIPCPATWDCGPWKPIWQVYQPVCAQKMRSVDVNRHSGRTCCVTCAPLVASFRACTWSLTSIVLVSLHPSPPSTTNKPLRLMVKSSTSCINTSRHHELSSPNSTNSWLVCAPHLTTSARRPSVNNFHREHTLQSIRYELCLVGSPNTVPLSSQPLRFCKCWTVSSSRRWVPVTTLGSSHSNLTVLSCY